MKVKEESKRNKVRQIVPIKDDAGNTIGHKNIFHEKKSNISGWGDRAAWWRSVNKAKRVKTLNPSTPTVNR
jgi:hypothetical protein